MTRLLAPERDKPDGEVEQERSAHSRDSKRPVLVLVDAPCTSPEICAAVRTYRDGRPTDALVIAPAHASASTRWYVDEDAARADARRRLGTCVTCLTRDGIRAEGRLADPDPVHAISDARRTFPAGEILLITGPQRRSSWLRQNTVDRARRRIEQPIRHVAMPVPPPQDAPHATLWKRFVARAGRGLQFLWRYRLGWLTGHSLLVLTHVGRRTGKQYRTVLYVQRYDRKTHEATVVSVWGESQWLRNIRAHPAVSVEIGLQRYTPEQRFLSTEEVYEIEKRFRRRHRIVAWGQARLMGWPWPARDEELLELSARLRGVTFRPAASGKKEAPHSPDPPRSSRTSPDSDGDDVGRPGMSARSWR